MKTRGEIEAAVCQGMSRFQQEFMGRGPKDIHAHLIGDLVLVRLRGVLTNAEQHLVQTLPSEKGRDLLKQVRTQLIEQARPILVEMILKATDANVVSLHQDISTATGEEVVIFILDHAPAFRETRRTSAIA
jgi:uncharacterized protein YbcI